MYQTERMDEIMRILKKLVVSQIGFQVSYGLLILIILFTENLL